MIYTHITHSLLMYIVLYSSMMNLMESSMVLYIYGSAAHPHLTLTSYEALIQAYEDTQ